MTKKTCTGCKKELPIKVFHFRNRARNKRHPWCRSCRNAQQTEYRRGREGKAKVRGWRKTKHDAHCQVIWNYLLTHPCIDCKESDPIVLQFDHQYNKRCNISQMPWSHGIVSILEEISKCEVRCANCHTRKTATEQNHWKVSYAGKIS